MKLIVGLGNPGEQYERTRHNLGFMAVEQFLKDFEPVKKTAWEDNKKFKADILEFEWQPRHGALEKVILAKPKTFMNNSGLAVKTILRYYDIKILGDVWIVHDDVDLPLGSLRIRVGGSSGGHRGVQSVIDHLGNEQFVRFRLGIGHPHRSSNTHLDGKPYVKDVDEFVLDNFTGAERGKIKDVLKNASRAMQMALESNLEAAANKYNTK